MSSRSQETARGAGFMLASRGLPADLDRLAARGYWFDLKIDGIRALIESRVDSGGPSSGGPSSAEADPVYPADDEQSVAITMTSRNGIDLTRRFPELVDALQQLTEQELTLDAEIAVLGSAGVPSWPRTLRRTQQSTPTAAMIKELQAQLYVFDVLVLRGQDVRSWPFHLRREALEELAGEWPTGIGLTVCSQDAMAMWKLIVTHGFEGVIAKAAHSRYLPGRSRDWVKIKATSTVTCLVGGVEWAGQEGTSDPRSLHLYLVNEQGELVPVGKASAGVAAPMRARLLSGIRKPPLIVEVEYAEISSGGVLRHPVVRAVRADVDVLACRLDQLTGVS
ncbi:MAG: hypothetical protein ACR2GB_04620 [Nocardioidaceae bacterium]